MRKVLFILLAIVITSTGCKNKKSAEYTKLGEYTPYDRLHEKLCGKVEKVTQKIYWVIPDGKTFKKGNLLNTHEHDSANLLYDFEVTFYESGAVKSSVYLDENNKVVRKWELFQENNILTIAKYTCKDTLRVYNKLKCNSNGDIIAASQFRNGVDTLIYSYTYTISRKGDTETLQNYDYRGNPFSKMVAIVDKDGQFLNVSNYNKDGIYTGGHEIILTEKGNLSERYLYDKDKNQTWEYCTGYEYDNYGNWIKVLVKDNKGTMTMYERTYTYFE
jgi:hypothetical protein